MPHRLDVRVINLELDSDFVLVTFLIGGTKLEVAAEVDFSSRSLVLRRLDIEGSGPNTLGLSSLRQIARWVMQVVDVDELRIEGAARTSGSGPGRRPAPVVFRRAGNRRSA